MNSPSVTARLALACALLFAAPAAIADTVTFQLIPDAASADDMSPDGRFIVGTATFASGGGAYRYDSYDQVFVHLPAPGRRAVAVSDDGSVVLGDMADPETGNDVAAIWRASTNTWESLGYFPGTPDLCGGLSGAYDLSADGRVAVGLGWMNGCHGRAFRWTAETGMVALQNLANGANRASVVSANGSLIAGFAQGSFDRTPAIWGATGPGQLLDPPNGNAQGEIFGMNPAGTILLGTWNGKATKWTNGNAVRTTIGAGSALPGWTGIPTGIANTGTIVGFDFIGGNRRAWLQPNGTGSIVALETYITTNGGTIPDELPLQVCQAISADGSRIIGHGLFTGGFLVTISNQSGCTADIAPLGGDGVVNGADLGQLLGQWSSAGADLNGDGITDGADLGILLGAWGPCPAATGACCVEGACTQKTAAECAAANGTFLGSYTQCGPFSCANNDACADAIDITSNMVTVTPVHGDNSAATPPKYGGTPDLDVPAGSPSCQWNGNPGAAHSSVWYRFTAPESGAVHLSTCSTVAIPFVDSIVTLYSGTCGSLVEVACNEDGCGDPIGSAPYYSDLVATGLVPGATYYVCIMNSGDWEGSMAGPFILSIEQF